ncbi:zf-DHHC-domain-containing protein [Ascobolus immersus RN42]|uniref:Palmitoyltransferase n=1 Tax=Ascobolus immersus RN42 TaxID=1160509 RepID=A0A3N4IN78_ASCIM|nr:zf-DHHC-domain-containing protein [Ascobolus immersus RN42]
MIENVPPRVTISGVVALILFLAYSPQHSFLEPYITKNQSLFFNFLLANLWVSYYFAVTASPGSPPKDWIPTSVDELRRANAKLEAHDDGQPIWAIGGERWCSKCEAWKPRRAHHCKVCKACVMKMDHQGPWTANCVGMANSAHFFRFLFYCVVSMIYLTVLMFSVYGDLFENSDQDIHSMPITVPQMVHMIVLSPILFITGFAITILLVRFIIQLATNTTTIESWENEKYEDSMNRLRKKNKTWYKQLAYPYDIGLWENLKEGLGKNPLAWLYVFSAGGPEVYSATKEKKWDWERQGGGGVRWLVNGFEPADTVWPPVDVEKKEWKNVQFDENGSWEGEAVVDREKFEERRKKWEGTKEGLGGGVGEGWKSSAGESLADFGVDEDGEGELFPIGGVGDDDEDVPLGELLRRRKAAKAAAEEE